MPRFHKLRTLPHPARSLFDLVLDIETYPQFLPWCLDARISNRRHDTLDGTLTVGTKLVRSSFTSLVRFDAATGVVSMQAQSNLFSCFQSRWHITPVAESEPSPQFSHVDFAVDFELRNLPLKPLFENLFERAASRMVEAFEARADFLAAQRSAPATTATPATPATTSTMLPPSETQ